MFIYLGKNVKFSFLIQVTGTYFVHVLENEINKHKLFPLNTKNITLNSYFDK